MMLKCQDGILIDFPDQQCFVGLHFLYVFLSILFSILFYIIIIGLTIFYFYPFNSKRTCTKIDTTADISLYIFKNYL